MSTVTYTAVLTETEEVTEPAVLGFATAGIDPDSETFYMEGFASGNSSCILVVFDKTAKVPGKTWAVLRD